jgi:hypothetical protein
MLRPVVFALVVMLLPAAEGRAQETLPVAVAVTTLDTPQLPKLKPEVHEAEIKRTRDEMYAVAAQLRKQHGDKTSAWPPEVWNVFYVAEDANTLAIARRDYEDPDTHLGLADSVEDVVRGASANKSMTMATAADEASLVVRIIARRAASAAGVTDNRYFIRFRLAPGGKMTGARFLELTQGYKWDSVWSKVIAHPKDASGYFELEAGSPASFKNCAALLRAVLEGFIKTRMDPAKKK